jgi:hypothetical protein
LTTFNKTQPALLISREDREKIPREDRSQMSNGRLEEGKRGATENKIT